MSYPKYDSLLLLFCVQMLHIGFIDLATRIFLPKEEVHLIEKARPKGGMKGLFEGVLHGCLIKSWHALILCLCLRQVFRTLLNQTLVYGDYILLIPINYCTFPRFIDLLMILAHHSCILHQEICRQGRSHRSG